MFLAALLRRWAVATGCFSASLAVLAMGGAALAAEPDAPIEIQQGDTFSAISARYTGKVGSWRTMYRPAASNLPNPHALTIGMRFELAQDEQGSYLRRIDTPTVASASRVDSASNVNAKPATVAAPPRVTNAAAPTATTAAAASLQAAAPTRAVPAPTPSEALVIGVLPNITAAALMGQYDHLRRYLERTQGRKVNIVVPANFKVFFDNMMAGEYDLAVAAPHFARVAQADRRFVPLVMYEPRINALMIAPLESTITGPRDVRERAVAFANPQSLVAMYGQQWLKQNGLEPSRDYEIKAARTDLGVGRMLLVGDAAAAIISNGEFRALPPEESARMKVVEVFARLPNFVIVANPRLDRDTQTQLKAALRTFLADKENGEAFGRATGFNVVVEADESQLRELDAFNAQTRRAMGFVN